MPLFRPSSCRFKDIWFEDESIGHRLAFYFIPFHTSPLIQA